MSPLDVRFQRSFMPLSRVIDSGATSMRQNDCGAASIAQTIAARMIAGWVTTIDRW